MNPIPTRSLGCSGVEVPALGFGGAPLGELFERLTEDRAQATLRGAWDCGIRYFDTAPWYGHGLSEHRIGWLLRQQDPAAFFCSTKVGRVYDRARGGADRDVTAPWAGGLPFVPRFDYTYAGVMRSFEDSLMRLGLNRVHALVIHDLDFGYHGSEANVGAKLRELDSGWTALEALRRSGEIEAIGVGVNEASMMPEFLDRWPIDFFLVAMPYTLLDQAVLDREFPACDARGVGVVIGAPYASGILATGAVEGVRYGYAPASAQARRKVARIEALCARYGVPLKAAALQFPLAHPLVASIIPGANTREQVEENRAMLEHAVPVELWAELRSEELIHADAPVPTPGP